jgi:antitoxin ParD1/3/4
MSRNTSVTLGNHFSEFVETKIGAGRFESTSEAVRAGLRLLEQQEAQIDLLRQKLAKGEAQLDRAEGVDGDQFMRELIT